MRQLRVKHLSWCSGAQTQCTPLMQICFKEVWCCLKPAQVKDQQACRMHIVQHLHLLLLVVPLPQGTQG